MSIFFGMNPLDKDSSDLNAQIVYHNSLQIASIFFINLSL